MCGGTSQTHEANAEVQELVDKVRCLKVIF